MPTLSRMTSFLRNVFAKQHSDRELDLEVHSYVDLFSGGKNACWHRPGRSTPRRAIAVDPMVALRYE
jgi:hypothetical protein